MSEYRVIITETLKRAVTVEAESREEAEEAVRRQYQNSEHILVAEDFDGVSFFGAVSRTAGRITLWENERAVS